MKDLPLLGRKENKKENKPCLLLIWERCTWHASREMKTRGLRCTYTSALTLCRLFSVCVLGVLFLSLTQVAAAGQNAVKKKSERVAGKASLCSWFFEGGGRPDRSLRGHYAARGDTAEAGETDSFIHLLNIPASLSCSSLSQE